MRIRRDRRVGKSREDSSAIGGWTCATDSSQEIEVQLYDLESEDEQDGIAGKQAGLSIEWSEMKKWEDVFGVPPEGGSNSAPVQVQAQCWQGTLIQRPSTNSIILSMEAEVTDGETTYVVGELPHNPQEAIDLDSYSCIWGFQQLLRWDDSENVPNTADQLFYNGEQKIFEPSVSSAPDNYGYLVAGSNQRGTSPLTTTYTVIRPDGELGNYSKGGASNLWQHFPEVGLDSTFDVDNPRHPLDVCRAQGGC